MKKDCNECINADSSICIYYCKKKSHFEKCPHNCMFCEQYGNCGLLKQRECQGQKKKECENMEMEDLYKLKKGDKVLVECTVEAVFVQSGMVMVTTRDCDNGFDAYVDEIKGVVNEQYYGISFIFSWNHNWRNYCISSGISNNKRYV